MVAMSGSKPRTAPLMPQNLNALKPKTYFPKIRRLTCLARMPRTFGFLSALTAALRTAGLLTSFRAIAFFTIFASLWVLLYAAFWSSRRSLLFSSSRRAASASVSPPCSAAMISSSRSP